MDWSKLGGGDGHLSSVAIVGVLVVAWLVRRNMRPRPLQIERLWVRPVLFAVMTGATVVASPIPYDPISLLIFVVALALGAGLGWQRGRFMNMNVHPETHDITIQASPIGLVLILLVLALKIALRGATSQAPHLLGLPTATLADGPVMLLGAMIVAQSLEMWLRARRLLAEAQAAKTAFVS